MNMRRNHRIIMLLLIAAIAVLLLAGVVTRPGTGRTVLMYLVIGLGVAAMIEGVLFALKPGWFRDKVQHQPHENRD
jgi:membrane-associated PAP2 superfamily phosphatase